MKSIKVSFMHRTVGLLLGVAIALAGCASRPDFAKIIRDDFLARPKKWPGWVVEVEGVRINRVVKVGDQSWCVSATYDITMDIASDPLRPGTQMNRRIDRVENNKFFIRRKPLGEWEVEGQSNSC